MKLCVLDTANAEDTFYVLASAVGPHPYPLIVKHFQSVISKETRKQLLEMEGKLPDAVMACGRRLKRNRYVRRFY